jgi:hypothetical protein
MGSTGLLWILAAVVVLAVVIYLFRKNAGKAEPTVRTAAPAEDPARALFAAAGDEPPTEDQIAQARLGGPRGDPKLGAAPMVRQQGENTPRHIDDGHVA